MTAIRVLVADDQKVVRDGLVLLLGLVDGLDVVGAAIDGGDAVRQAAALRPDVVLMDLNMPRIDGVEATRRLLADQPQVRVIALTTYDDDEWVFRALRAGARGYLTKDASAAEIEKAIRTVAAGEAQLDPSVQRRLLDSLVSGSARTPPAEEAPTPPIGLTTRELEVLRLIAAGHSNTQIAAELHIAMTTVKTHVGNLLTKTGSRDRAQLVGFAFRAGIGSRGNPA